MRPPITDDQFSALIEEHKGIIYKIANSYCRNAEDRKDLIQEIIVHLWKSHDRYDDRFKLSTWIYRIALNVAISAYRREKKRSDRVSPLEAIIVEPAAETEPPDPRIATLHRIIDQLDELNRAPAALPWVHELFAFLDEAGIPWVIATSSRAEQVKASAGIDQESVGIAHRLERGEAHPGRGAE